MRIPPLGLSLNVPGPLRNLLKGHALPDADGDESMSQRMPATEQLKLSTRQQFGEQAAARSARRSSTGRSLVLFFVAVN